MRIWEEECLYHGLVQTWKQVTQILAYLMYRRWAAELFSGRVVDPKFIAVKQNKVLNEELRMSSKTATLIDRRRKHLQNFVFFFPLHNLNLEWLANSDICYYSSIHTSPLCSYLSVTTINALLTCRVSPLAEQFSFPSFSESTIMFKHLRLRTRNSADSVSSLSPTNPESHKEFILEGECLGQILATRPKDSFCWFCLMLKILSFNKLNMSLKSCSQHITHVPLLPELRCSFSQWNICLVHQLVRFSFLEENVVILLQHHICRFYSS